MVVLVTCKNEEDPIKIKALEWPQGFPHYNPIGAMCCDGSNRKAMDRNRSNQKANPALKNKAGNK